MISQSDMSFGGGRRVARVPLEAFGDERSRNELAKPGEIDWLIPGKSPTLRKNIGFTCKEGFELEGKEIYLSLLLGKQGCWVSLPYELSTS